VIVQLIALKRVFAEHPHSGESAELGLIGRPGSGDEQNEKEFSKFCFLFPLFGNGKAHINSCANLAREDIA